MFSSPRRECTAASLAVRTGNGDGAAAGQPALSQVTEERAAAVAVDELPAQSAAASGAKRLLRAEDGGGGVMSRDIADTFRQYIADISLDVALAVVPCLDSGGGCR